MNIIRKFQLHFVFHLARQTKSLNVRNTINRHITGSSKVTRNVIGLPPSRSSRAATKVKSKEKFFQEKQNV